jgi:SAM-dependent methyltransferase
LYSRNAFKAHLSKTLLPRLLAHPLTKGLDLDDPATTDRRRRIIQSKAFLRAIYDEWYSLLASQLPLGGDPVLELGSGAGYCDRYIPGLITSEVFYCSGIQLALDAQRLPFADRSLRAIVFTDVLHHIPNVQKFFFEASRCLRSGGKILMIEPWVTRWSRCVYGRVHHEPFCPDAEEWSFPSSGPLSGANGALPWIVFERDRQKFATEFPELVVEKIRPFLAFRYLLSGGVSMRSLVPGFTHPFWARLEQMLEPYMSTLGMFAFIAVRRR